MFELFQFHTGSIKSGAEGVAFARVGRFNSTLVRLKALSSRWAPALPSPGFNSTLVRLKGNMLDVDELLEGFNSTLVRLKGGIVRNGEVKTWFQFHTGSIKSYGIRRHMVNELLDVSIPHWFD